MRTRVGYAGGTTQTPTYKQMGDHTECLQIDFDPTQITFDEIARHFWNSHNSNRGNYKGRQYLSIILYHDINQKEAIEKIKQEIQNTNSQSIGTEIAPLDQFTLAEEKHQKYYLKRYSNATKKLREYFQTEEAFTDATLVARLNSFVKGYGTLSSLKEEIMQWESEDAAELISLVSELRW
ncbi:peptide-methionine (S)-S-oxide reductase MsrA [Sutcliffiella horikoshii]|uniref:peptide-methionine (S)-S-oxide reductase MsrA n=1 Tax=Sutcliffiella horikoshii TaxID=79883 RepID=UPI001FEBF43C|nr:peptide-methionine (S)-S-oxide reductase [Sutcliffiella horikoshii]